MKKVLLQLFGAVLLFSCASTGSGYAQIENNNGPRPGYWQQHVDYKMEIDLDVENYRFHGTQELIYTNNSPDTLNRVFYHLYFNAFQPGSEMDVRSRTISDPDRRVGGLIFELGPDEIGYILVNSLSQDGINLKHETVGTILEVELAKPLPPGGKSLFKMDFDGQVPVQIRRSGRNNREGVALSMAQWYPKMAEYDFEGWHAHPYIAREFHGVWGNFDVKISIDKNYIIGGTGYLQNPNEIGYGYETGPVKRPSGDKLTWHFYAPNVHDFTWAADPDYIHDTLEIKDGPTLHFLYKNNPEIIENWKKLQPVTAGLMRFFSSEIGKYPYDQYSVIQGGDGGMEYGMCTLITGGRDLRSLISVTSHELAHSWFQFVLATNESKHEWMDEGFTSYISAHAQNHVLERGLVNPNAGSYRGYFSLVASGKEQPQSTHADRYAFNSAYGSAAYSKGAVFLAQLGYVIGKDNLKKTLKKYFKDWAFKHPTPNDFIRVAEKVSGLELDWYLNDWTRTTNTIDYGIKELKGYGTGSKITLERIGLMPMPIDLTVKFKDGSQENFYIPLQMMRGEKPVDQGVKVLEDWPWAFPEFEIELNRPVEDIEEVILDPENGVADVNRNNNLVKG